MPVASESSSDPFSPRRVSWGEAGGIELVGLLWLWLLMCWYRAAAVAVAGDGYWYRDSRERSACLLRVANGQRSGLLGRWRDCGQWSPWFPYAVRMYGRVYVRVYVRVYCVCVCVAIRFFLHQRTDGTLLVCWCRGQTMCRGLRCGCCV